MVTMMMVHASHRARWVALPNVTMKKSERTKRRASKELSRDREHDTPKLVKAAEQRSRTEGTHDLSYTLLWISDPVRPCFSAITS